MKEKEIINSKKRNIHTRADNHCTLLDSAVNNIYSHNRINTKY